MMAEQKLDIGVDRERVLQVWKGWGLGDSGILRTVAWLLVELADRMDKRREHKKSEAA